MYVHLEIIYPTTPKNTRDVLILHAFGNNYAKENSGPVLSIGSFGRLNTWSCCITEVTRRSHSTVSVLWACILNCKLALLRVINTLNNKSCHFIRVTLCELPGVSLFRSDKQKSYLESAVRIWFHLSPNSSLHKTGRKRFKNNARTIYLALFLICHANKTVVRKIPFSRTRNKNCDKKLISWTCFCKKKTKAVNQLPTEINRAANSKSTGIIFLCISCDGYYNNMENLNCHFSSTHKPKIDEDSHIIEHKRPKRIKILLNQKQDQDAPDIGHCKREFLLSSAIFVEDRQILLVNCIELYYRKPSIDLHFEKFGATFNKSSIPALTSRYKKVNLIKRLEDKSEELTVGDSCV
ncbi:hypothetical protein EDC94DRAFT_580329 [Helicostylum pulchrum]|nr:hypothetical protein EDC94DRAFT_580329 [Helicostylum pulchrum]